MPITSAPQATPVDVRVSLWTVSDSDRLAELVAWLLLGRHAFVRRLLGDDNPIEPSVTEKSIDEAISELACPIQTEVVQGVERPHHTVTHRDGWLFQFMSWIVALGEYPAAIGQAPHAGHSRPGFDGLLLEMDGLAVLSALYFEDKATDQPRETVRDEVWKAYTALESGLRDSELVSIASTLLAQVPGLDPDFVTKEANWFNQKRYRTSVATSSSKLPAQVQLFHGYIDVVPGDVSRRLANVLAVNDLRPFMEDLAQRTIGRLNFLRPPKDV